MATVITTYHLEMTDPAQLRPSLPRPDLDIRQARIPLPELNRFLYSRGRRRLVLARSVAVDLSTMADLSGPAGVADVDWLHCR